MARRPDILGDRDNWGAVLNEYLDVSLAEDGTIRPEAVPAAQPGAPTEPERTLSVVGDIHEGLTLREGNGARLDAAFADLATLTDLHVHRLYVGDLVDTVGSGHGGAEMPNDTAVLARITALDPERSRWDAVAGNHDLAADRSGDQWAALYGYADQNWTRDLEFVRVVAIAPDGSPLVTGQSQTMSAETVSWLDATLGESGKDTIILSHGPLDVTVPTSAPGGEYVGGYSSANDAFHTAPRTELRAILDKHPQVRAWVCGHTHGGYEAVGAIDRLWTGSRYVAHINAGSIAYEDYNLTAEEDALRSLFLTVLPDRIDARVRDHRAGTWQTLRSFYAYPLPPEPVQPDTGNPTAFVFPLAGDADGEAMDGPATLTLSGSPTFADIDGEQGMSSPADGSQYARINASPYLIPGQGTLIVRARHGAGVTQASMMAQQSAISGQHRIYLQRSAGASRVAQATIGGVDGGGAPYSAGTPWDGTVADGVTATYGLSWRDGAAWLYVDGILTARLGYTGLTTIGTIMNFGRYLDGHLLGVAGFRRALTRREHQRFVDASSDDWTMTTVLG